MGRPGLSWCSHTSLGHFNPGVSSSELEPPCEVLPQMGVAGILVRGLGGGIPAQSITQPVAWVMGSRGPDWQGRAQPPAGGWAGRSHPDHSDVRLPPQGLFDVSVCRVAMGPGRQPRVSQGDLPGWGVLGLSGSPGHPSHSRPAHLCTFVYTHI